MINTQGTSILTLTATRMDKTYTFILHQILSNIKVKTHNSILNPSPPWCEKDLILRPLVQEIQPDKFNQYLTSIKGIYVMTALLTCSEMFVPPTTIAVLKDSRDRLKALTYSRENW